MIDDEIDNGLGQRGGIRLKTAYIINPVAGRGRTEKIWKNLQSALQSLNNPGHPYFTAGPGDAQKLASQLSLNGYKRIFVFGGDGTVNEVLNGISLNGTVLGIIPTGTGNDFCRAVGIPKSPKEALMQLTKGKIKHVDIGVVNGRRFLNAVGAGFDAEVVKVTNEQFHQLRGTLAYLASLIKVLATYRNHEITVETEGAVFKGKMLLAGVGNGRYIGGGLKMFPQAEVDDGVFQVVMLGDIKKSEILFHFPKIFTGTHLSHPLISSLTANKLVIKSNPPLTVQVDGEIIGKTPIEIELLPQVLPILVP